MKKATLFLSLFFCFILTNAISQETFEDQVKQIAINIENITREEKDILKTKVEAVNVQLQNGEITADQATAEKERLAQATANAIEFRVTQQEKDLMYIIQNKVDGNIKSNDTISYNYSISTSRLNWNEKRTCSTKRTDVQLVFAIGFDNLVTNRSIANSEYLYLTSFFGEWGFVFNTRLLNKSNLLHLKYGISLMKNQLRPSDNQYFVVDGNQTNLEKFPTNLRDSRFKNNYWVAPIHLEFDFSGNKSKDGERVFKSQQGWRLGFGGYGGFNTKSKQKLYFKEDDVKVRTKEKKDFNVNDYIYGVSTYIGYKDISIYCKYDLNPLFKDNPIEQNNISLGLRFDFN